jgi:hypothetical protein
MDLSCLSRPCLPRDGGIARQRQAVTTGIALITVPYLSPVVKTR